MAEKHEQAESDYMAGMKYKDIAEKHGVALDTVKSWKKRYGWDRKKGAHKTEKGCTQKMVILAPVDDGTKETLQNEELTTEQRMFCIYYSIDHNAVQSYLKAYNCTYTTACGHAHRLLKKVEIKKEIDGLLEQKVANFNFNINELIELQMRIAFADVGNYMKFGMKDIYDSDTDETYSVSTVNLKESDYTDTQLIQEVKRGKDGVSIKLSDKQRAIDWLSKYFLIHPDDRYRAEFDKKKLEKEEEGSTGGVVIVNDIPRADKPI